MPRVRNPIPYQYLRKRDNPKIYKTAGRVDLSGQEDRNYERVIGAIPQGMTRESKLTRQDNLANVFQKVFRDNMDRFTMEDRARVINMLPRIRDAALLEDWDNVITYINNLKKELPPSASPLIDKILGELT